MKLFIDIVMKRIYLFNIVAWHYRKEIGFLVCKKENFAGLQAHRKRGKRARASPTPHHSLNEERRARFTAQPLSALVTTVVVRSRSILNSLIRRSRLRKGGGGGGKNVSPHPPRVFRISFYTSFHHHVGAWNRLNLFILVGMVHQKTTS